MTLDPAVADLLAVVDAALEGLARWPAPAIRSALGRGLAGQDDPGAAADWLREFLAQRAVDWVPGESYAGYAHRSDGYHGAVFAQKDATKVWECEHAHPTPTEAKICAGAGVVAAERDRAARQATKAGQP